MARFTTKTLILLVVISAVAKYCFAANILILSLPFYSHLVGIAKVGKYLQSEGHDVRIAIPPQLEEKLQDYGIKPLLYHCLDEPYISPSDLQAKAQLWIVQRHSMMNYNPPSMPNVKRLPHLLDLTPKPLPQEYLSFLENADNGVVLVSFGSVLSSMPAQVKDKLLQAFGQTKYKFITQSSLQQKNQSDKFMSRKWLPQFDLLRHKKTKLFITHCGANGLQEALTAGVPIIGFPVFGDQPYNAVNMEKNGFGLKLDIKSFSVDELVSAIEEVVTNPSYKSKVEKASAIFQSERVPPIEEAAYWINHVLKFGGDHLRSYAQDIPLWKYLGLDIIAFCLFLWHVVVYLVITLLRCCLSRCCGSKQKLKDE
ncbi:UDP-glucuronosyltransferase 2B33-like isoform X2 [Dendronephthya gigantea]|uniref:UDP-glucuronosyltransferase 2B33-like isoform X2 n=1 Tax=Dendronephthya gigantea TaxID=151771 RepID=UPI00106A9685|nr:UDP-glucuronosyltransferase 2B33-like isoform X2 [Dendronephthya gigantea]